MLQLHNQHPRSPRRNPLLVILVRFLLHDPVVPCKMKPFRIFRLQIRIGRLRPKIIKLRGVMILRHDQRECASGCSSNPHGTITTADRNTGRPQNFVSSAD